MKTLNLIIAAIITLTLTLTSCQSKTITRMDASKETNLSGRWNDTDSRLVSEEMTKDCLSRPWITDHKLANDAKPIVVVGLIKNKSHEHIEAETFIKDLEKECINSGLVKIVQGQEFREALRNERSQQGKFSSAETMKKWKNELGADYMLTGTINTIVDQEGNKKVVFYQVNLELSNIETTEKVWLGDKKIKKYIKN